MAKRCGLIIAEETARTAVRQPSLAAKHVDICTALCSNLFRFSGMVLFACFSTDPCAAGIAPERGPPSKCTDGCEWPPHGMAEELLPLRKARLCVLAVLPVLEQASSSSSSLIRAAGGLSVTVSYDCG